MQWIRQHLKIVVPVVVGLIALGAFLAFGVFGIHLLFIDDTVDEAVPVFESGAESAPSPSDPVEVDVTDPPAPSEPDSAGSETATSTPTVTNELDVAPSPAPTSPPETDPPAPVVVSQYDGAFIPRSHPGEGLASVLGDGSAQRFLRFEDFSTDNGPDLNVYLTRADATADEGAFDDDFIDLGTLKGNVGPQNYEIPPDVNLDEYGTVVVWCVRFSVAFTAADLIATGA